MSTNPLNKETKQINSIQNQIDYLKCGQNHINVQFNGCDYKISSVEKIKGNKKADFVLLNEKNNPVIFISHKDGKTVKHFQQLSGVSSPNIINHTFVNSFVDYLKDNYPNGIPKGYGTIASKEIPQNKSYNRELLHKCVFGDDHKNEYGIDNVNALIQGNIKFTIKNNGYDITSDSHFIINHNDSSQKLPFETRIMAMYRSDRNNQGLPKTRIMIAPTDSRKIKLEV